jgi:hypothetical protein
MHICTVLHILRPLLHLVNGDPAMSLAPITPTAMASSFSGNVSDAAGHALAGVTINLTGSQSRSTITDANGNYSFADVETNGFYSVTPVFANYSFSPPSTACSCLALPANLFDSPL